MFPLELIREAQQWQAYGRWPNDVAHDGVDCIRRNCLRLDDVIGPERRTFAPDAAD
jgi:hypothetical protein